MMKYTSVLSVEGSSQKKSDLKRAGCADAGNSFLKEQLLAPLQGQVTGSGENIIKGSGYEEKGLLWSLWR